MARLARRFIDMSNQRATIPVSSAQRPLYGGVDLGGTNIKLGIVDDNGRTLAYRSAPTQVEAGPENGVQRMASLLSEAASEAGVVPADLAAIGVGSPGPLDIAGGVILNPSNLPGWWNFPICPRLAELCGRPVFFSNDANAAAHGEFWAGSGKAFHSMVMFTLGTGVGGAILVGEQSVDGEHGAGAELGHIIIDYHATARRCPCGLTGHLEGYASATAVIERTEEALATGRPSSLTTRLSGGEKVTPLLLAEEAERGDALSLEIILDTARFLGIGIASMMHTVDPNGVVIGGAMTFGMHERELGRRFLDAVRKEVAKRAFPILLGKTVVDYASLGGDAGYIGAAAVARMRHRQGAAK